MLLRVPEVLKQQQVAQCRQRLAQAPWLDGRVTAGFQSARAKHNGQLDQTSVLARELGAAVHDAVLHNALFFSAALPHIIFPPLFNRYTVGESFGDHIDNAIRYDRSQQPARAVRTDLSATLFLSDPAEYDGGELVIEDSSNPQRIKFAAGDLVLYSASHVHRVEAVTRGERIASFFWIQSMVRDAAARRILFDLDQAIQQLTGAHAEHAASVALTGVYHNLLRRWSHL